MIGALLQVANLGLGSTASEGGATGFRIPSAYIGFVVLGLILIPVITLVLSAIFGAPRNIKVPGLFMVCLAVLISATVAGFALIGSLLGFVFPS